MKNFGFALAIAFCASFVSSQHVQADVIAEVYDDYQLGGPATGWSYLWNPAGISIGDSANYAAITPGGTFYAETTGVAVGTEAGTGNRLDLRVTGGTPSLRVISGLDASAAAPGDTIDHYNILRYTVQPGEAGDVTFDSSQINFNANAGNSISAYKNDVLVGTVSLSGDNAVSFDYGTVAVGDTLDLAFLTPDNSGATRNARRFFVSSNSTHEFNRTISVVPEPGSVALIGLGIMGLVARRRR